LLMVRSLLMLRFSLTMILSQVEWITMTLSIVERVRMVSPPNQGLPLHVI